MINKVFDKVIWLGFTRGDSFKTERVLHNMSAESAVTPCENHASELRKPHSQGSFYEPNKSHTAMNYRTGGADYRVANRGNNELQMEQELGQNRQTRSISTNEQDVGQILTNEVKTDYRRNRFPYSVVFQPLPPLTWLLPFIGHMGICDSHGRVHDFQGPYTVREVSARLPRPQHRPRGALGFIRYTSTLHSLRSVFYAGFSQRVQVPVR
jgi:hypothetical protein